MFHDPRFWSAVAFVLFFVLFGRSLWKPLVSALDGRAERIRAELDEAARLRREAEQMLEDATRDREAAIAEAKELVEHSLREAAIIAEQANKNAAAVAARCEQMAKDRIASAERSALREVREMAIEIAIQATGETLAASLNADTDGKIVDKSISDMPAILSQRAA